MIQNNFKLIAIDTAISGGSVALYQDCKLQNIITDSRPSMQSESLITMLEDLLQQSNMAYSDIDYIAINIGPGSFTGLRISITVVKMLAMIHNIKIIPIISLAACYYNIWHGNNAQERQINIILEAGRGRLYHLSELSLYHYHKQQPNLDNHNISISNYGDFVDSYTNKHSNDVLVNISNKKINNQLQEILTQNNITWQDVILDAKLIGDLAISILLGEHITLKNNQEDNNEHNLNYIISGFELIPLYISAPDAKIFYN